MNFVMRLVNSIFFFFFNKHFNTETSNTIRDIFIAFSLQASSFVLVRRRRRCHRGLALLCAHKVRRSSHQLPYAANIRGCHRVRSSDLFRLISFTECSSGTIQKLTICNSHYD
jgi:hypothetical protein